MNEEPNPAKETNQPGKRKATNLFALLLAFVPSVLLIALLAFAGSSNPPAILLALSCVTSLTCCFVSAFLLFRRNTVLAILFGILFLNGAFSFFFGCATILTGMKF
jgi:hypothetical protein